MDPIVSFENFAASLRVVLWKAFFPRAALNYFFLCFWFPRSSTVMYLSGSFSLYLSCLGLSNDCICSFISFISFGKFSTIISSNIASSPFSLLSPWYFTYVSFSSFYLYLFLSLLWFLSFCLSMLHARYFFFLHIFWFILLLAVFNMRLNLYTEYLNLVIIFLIL